MVDEKLEPKSNSIVITITIFLFFLQILLNFIGSPLVKYIFAVASFTTFLAVLSQPFKKVIWLLLIFSVFEGQGRIVWGYHPVFRVIFDFLSLIFIARVFAKYRKVIDKSYYSQMTIIFLILHFSWWCLELFNPNGAGFGPSFITAKYYIFPIFLFLSFMTVEIDVGDVSSQKMIFILFIIVILINLLCFHQQDMKTTLMAQVSPNYLNLFAKFKEFTGSRFRPWGTSHSPGGMSIFNYLLVPLFFLFDPSCLTKVPLKKLGLSLITYAFIATSLMSCFLSQVRSAFFKMILIFGLIYVVRFLSSNFKLKQVLVSLLLLIAVGVYSPQLLNQEAFKGAIGRFSELSEDGAVTSQRGGLMEVYVHLLEKVDFPMGFGLGMTTGYSSAFQAKREQKMMFGANEADYWSLDNLYAFLFLELGIGAVFYIGILLSILSTLLMGMLRFLKERDKRSEITGMSFVIFLALLAGDWGAVSIPFNPISFSMWLWISIGLGKLTLGKVSEEPDKEEA